MPNYLGVAGQEPHSTQSTALFRKWLEGGAKELS